MAYYRHPKGYDGAQVTSRGLGSLLSYELERIQKRRSCNPQEVLAIWPTIIGNEMSTYTSAERFQEGVLYVRVANSTVYSLLARQEKPLLLEELRKRLPSSGVRNIIFRLG